MLKKVIIRKERKEIEIKFTKVRRHTDIRENEETNFRVKTRI
jgi:transcription elongation GreA/GreB family factor